MANRIKKVIPELVISTQVALLKDRSIGENIILAHEMLRKIFKTKKGKGFCLKVDIKAFDKVRWNYIIENLNAMNFPKTWINLIKESFPQLASQFS